MKSVSLILCKKNIKQYKVKKSLNKKMHCNPSHCFDSPGIIIQNQPQSANYIMMNQGSKEWVFIFKLYFKC
jgi:hypothetical protein